MKHYTLYISHFTVVFFALCAMNALRADDIVFSDGQNYTDDIYLANTTGTFVVNGSDSATISGRISGTSDSRGNATGGAFIKTGAGTLFITGERNWFLGPNTVSEGTLVVTHVGALGRGNIAVAPAATLVFSGIRGGDNFPQAITGGGRVEVTDSDMTFNVRDSFVIAAPATANNVIGEFLITRSRLFALASGTLSSALGGSGASVGVIDNSTLLIGRTGVAAGVAGLATPVYYPVIVRNLGVDATSALVLNPGANLTVSGTLALAPGATFTFGGAGIARLEYGVLHPGSASPDDLASAPAGYYTLDTALLVGEAGRQRRDYLILNQGANPMRDTAMTTAAIDTIVSTVASRLNELFLLPVAEATRFRQSRKWASIAWARYFAGEVDYESSGSHPGHSGQLNGLILGLDGAYRQRVNLGIYGGLTESSFDTTSAASLLSKQRYFGVSATPRFKRFYVSADLFSGAADSESRRHEAYGSTTAHWKNSFHGGGIEAGAVLRPWKDGFLRPRAGVRYMSVGTSGYTERVPAGGSAVSVKNFTDSLAHLNMAVEGAHRVKFLKRDTLLGATLGYKHFVREPATTRATTFRDYPGSFTLERGDYCEDTASLGVSARMVLTPLARAGLSLDYERGAHHDRLTASVVVNCIW